MDVIDEKRELRARLRAARTAIPSEQIAMMSAAIVQCVRSSPAWARARAIAGFVGVNGEPDTRALLELAIAEGKALWLPRVLGARDLGFAQVHGLAQLEPGGFGLLEPPSHAANVPLSAVALDLVLVPGLAFTSDGARLGFGRGYYDRALAPFANDETPLRLGVCFTAFLDRELVPTDAHDVPMHAIATEHGIVVCA